MLKNNKSGLLQFVDSMQANGLCHFTRPAAIAELDLDKKAFDQAIFRLSSKKRVTSICRGFYLVIPPEYRKRGIIPPDWFIDDLMSYLGRKYYVGLLSASLYHGASHQKPQIFQVIVDKTLRPISRKGLAISFIRKKDLAKSVSVKFNTRTGYVSVSSCETTAIDLVRYSEQAGGLDHVLSVIRELAESLDPQKLLDVAKREGCMAYAQRLGWLIEKAGHGGKTRKLVEWVKNEKPAFTVLDPQIPRQYEKDLRWRLNINANPATGEDSA